MSDPSGAVTPDAPSAAPTSAPAETPASNPAPSDTQTSAASTEASTPEPLDWDTLSQHPEFQKRFEEEANKKADALAQKRLDRQARRALAQQAQQALADDDADTGMQALRDAQRYIADPEDGATLPLAEKEAALRQSKLVDSDEYKSIFYSPDRDALDKAFAELTPSQLEKWVQDKFAERKAAEDKRITEVAKAIAEQMTNERLGGLPTQLTGGSPGQMSDTDILLAYGRGEYDDHERVQKILAARR